MTRVLTRRVLVPAGPDVGGAAGLQPRAGLGIEKNSMTPPSPDILKLGKVWSFPRYQCVRCRRTSPKSLVRCMVMYYMQVKYDAVNATHKNVNIS